MLVEEADLTDAADLADDEVTQLSDIPVNHLLIADPHDLIADLDLSTPSFSPPASSTSSPLPCPFVLLILWAPAASQTHHLYLSLHQASGPHLPALLQVSTITTTTTTTTTIVSFTTNTNTNTNTNTVIIFIIISISIMIIIIISVIIILAIIVSIISIFSIILTGD
ncbi:hypothetical protein GUITHDRAFT_108548 [Guillardia theta CCMP2712]|uniref:Uncharacterized protein n=1 Tax=Guillardia theta (strain CCMP2712) TaxID=905079 RepID=L1JBI0_GUITC|nr:hypothetical protein GUITHDRAFT_108548 [Guillardia theta CCMP2712]EKX45672.1 hypothetical protein GUITHDRAFT_108548 [Guillardia theta CCMP2712]|eukprot:XP_005832652.1 hypothetical protein GUITHDRAFT_108548 [Guillardia theta CCMP2712]